MSKVENVFLHILAESFAESVAVGRVFVVGRLFVSGIVCRGVFFGFDCGPCDGGCGWQRCLNWFHFRRGRAISETLALYVQVGYARRMTRKCCFRDRRCRGL